ncbi:hypothetical protein DFH07DRAFT_732639 [Mycena maculata]|uniref:Uncharacterized protein n=1 Tax=Mycena maculata TaxID=230809 RepID=A0AAD7JYP6_9AGAR|nr:hypothetical protein DFH07DRAFT_732639 [Mycena maculata]
METVSLLWLCYCCPLFTVPQGLLQAYCGETFTRLEAQKTTFLSYHEDAQYPTDASIFSAATFESGGTHTAGPDRRLDHYQPGTWNILTALGIYAPVHGGHIVFWDLGLVVTFPPGCSILIPAGVVRYSFVKVREGEQRYSVLQWAGAGIARWFDNGLRRDAEFAAEATCLKHEQREARRHRAHEEALDLFPINGELPEETIIYEFLGTNPDIDLD